MGAKITAIEYFLPKKTLTNNDLEKVFEGWDGNRAEKKIGIRQRHISAENETALDMSVNAAKKIFTYYNKKNIDFILFCTQSPDYYLPSVACILQNKLGLSTSIGALDINLGCSGYVYALSLAKGLLATKVAKNILLITADTYSKYIHPKDKTNRPIFGDAAAATIISHSDEEKIMEFDFGTDGSGKDNLIVKNGCARNTYNTNAPVIENDGSLHTDNNLYMNGAEIFNFTIEKVPIVLNNVLYKNRTTLDQVDYFVFHQANKYILSYLRKKLHIPEDKFCIDMLDTGNTVSSTLPIALKNMLENNIIKTNDKVLLLGFGVGYSWGGVIVSI